MHAVMYTQTGCCHVHATACHLWASRGGCGTLKCQQASGRFLPTLTDCSNGTCLVRVAMGHRCVFRALSSHSCLLHRSLVVVGTVKGQKRKGIHSQGLCQVSCRQSLNNCCITHTHIQLSIEWQFPIEYVKLPLNFCLLTCL